MNKIQNHELSSNLVDGQIVKQNSHIPPNLLLYVKVDPFEALIVDPSPPKIVEVDVGGCFVVDELEGCGAPVEDAAAVLFFGFITVK